MDRLVGHAQQHAIGHAKAKALRGDAGAFHIHGDSARLREQLALLHVAKLPIAVGVGDDRSGPQTTAEFGSDRRPKRRPPPAAARPEISAIAGIGTFERHVIVEDLVATQISVPRAT
ncbi:MAG: hypothetical protein WDM79_10885 [Terricaulis sp.]